VDLATVARGRTAQVRTVALRVTIGLVVGGVLVFTFLRLVGAAGAAFALERSKVLNYLLDEGGTALADSCATCCRSVHIIEKIKE